MLNFLSNIVMHPALLAGGALLVAAPILIHLLNKRKFKIIEWAAMDFLFDADKRNRRRVRLEDLVILLLRALAVLLIVLLLARPFLPGTVFGGLTGTVSHERIVLLDDSPSMEVRQGTESPFQQAKRVVADLVRGLGNRHSSDTLTVLVTSRPRQPIVASATLTQETVDKLVTDIAALKPSSRGAHYEGALAEVDKLAASRVNLNSIVYVLTDLRARDWNSAGADANKAGVAAQLAKLADKTTNTYVVDVGNDRTDNLAITAIVPQEKVLGAGLTCRFDVTVQNFGPADVTHVGVRFQPEGSLPTEGWIDRIAAHESAAVPFTYTFARTGSTGSTAELDPVPIKAELILPAGADLDRLPVDNVRYFPARVVQGISTLVVDGDPTTTDPRRAESYYLRRALAPRGDTPSGIALRVVSAPEFETLDIDPFQVIYLANIDRISDSRRESLEAWVRQGGGLVLALGDQLADKSAFNAQFYRQGAGLSPLEVDVIRGDERERQWALFNVVQKGHEVVSVFDGENNPFLEGVKVFRWWQSHVSDESLHKGQARVLVKLNDSEQSPAIVEQTYGRGRVVVITTPLDGDWCNWPDDPSYLLVMQYLTRYLTPATSAAGQVEVGQPITMPLDLVKYKVDVKAQKPDGDSVGVQPTQAATKSAEEPGAAKAKPPAAAKTADDATWQLSLPDVDQRGFYRFELSRNDGGADTMLFAANLDPQEGKLDRADIPAIGRQLAPSRARIVSGASLMETGAEGSKAELWLAVLGALGMVLGSEQLLAWAFGRNR